MAQSWPIQRSHHHHCLQMRGSQWPGPSWSFQSVQQVRPSWAVKWRVHLWLPRDHSSMILQVSQKRRSHHWCPEGRLRATERPLHWHPALIWVGIVLNLQFHRLKFESSPRLGRDCAVSALSQEMALSVHTLSVVASWKEFGGDGRVRSTPSQMGCVFLAAFISISASGC